MNIYTPDNCEDVIITVSPLEYRRLFQIIKDHAIEYGSKGDMIFDMLDIMKKFNGDE